MDAKTATTVINGILSACDNVTRQSIIKRLSVQHNERKPKHRIAIIDAKEDLIKNHFKR